MYNSCFALILLIIGQEGGCCNALQQYKRFGGFNTSQTKRINQLNKKQQCIQ